MSYDIVIPTAGRPSLTRLLSALRGGGGPGPRRIIVVDDRARTDGLPRLSVPADVEVLAGGARGPAAARNAGWRAASAAWVVFLDDDVVPAPAWPTQLAEDLNGLPPAVAASQGRVSVPMPSGRPATDWERNVKGLEGARWATADMAIRRAALAHVGGFDERFTRAYREDSELGLRLLGAGYELVLGRRTVEHPVGPADPWISLRRQAGNADDALMRALHGPGWRRRAGSPAGRFPAHVATCAAGLGAMLLARSGRRRIALAAGATWSALTARFAWARIAPGPRTLREVVLMGLTSAAIPPLAGWHWAAGTLRSAGQHPLPGEGAGLAVDAVLLDRDGTLVEDVPYNGDPDLVRPLPGVAAALERLRRHGVKLALVSNQSGIARGLIKPDQVYAVNERLESMVGPLGPWVVCPHGPDDGCTCRKPAPGLLLRAAAELGVAPERCVMIGDIGADVRAAGAAGIRAILVPTAQTRSAEIDGAAEVAPTLRRAVDRLLAHPPSA